MVIGNYYVMGTDFQFYEEKSSGDKCGDSCTIT